MPPEQTLLEAETRKVIDEKMAAAGWAIQDKAKINLFEKLGVAVREFKISVGQCKISANFTLTPILPLTDPNSSKCGHHTKAGAPKNQRATRRYNQTSSKL
jgi:hypothetical protein